MPFHSVYSFTTKIIYGIPIRLELGTKWDRWENAIFRIFKSITHFQTNSIPKAL
jgi:hypothetical protein